jgi:hypothetical protein
VDEGMTETQATELARVVRDETTHSVSVEPDEGAFIVVVRRSIGDSWILRDEQDWAWLAERIRPER